MHRPERAQEREDGEKKGKAGRSRQRAGKTDKEVQGRVRTNVPSDVYCSNAYYTFPNLPMAEINAK